MIYDLQKASLLKRLSAWLLDFILLTIAITGVAWGLSALMNVNANVDIVSEKFEYYEKEYGFDLNLTPEQFEALPQEKQELYKEGEALFAKDEEFGRASNLLFYQLLSIVSLSILLAYLLVELLPMLLFRNGQTLGKKIFGVALMQVNGVRVTNFAVFARTVMGKCTIETLIPAVLLAMMFFGVGGFVGLTVIGGILILEVVLIIRTKTNSMIHDVLAYTVAVDLQSQMIFENEQELLEYKQRIHAEAASRSPY